MRDDGMSIGCNVLFQKGNGYDLIDHLAMVYPLWTSMHACSCFQATQVYFCEELVMSMILSSWNSRLQDEKESWDTGRQCRCATQHREVRSLTQVNGLGNVFACEPNGKRVRREQRSFCAAPKICVQKTCLTSAKESFYVSLKKFMQARGSVRVFRFVLELRVQSSLGSLLVPSFWNRRSLLAANLDQLWTIKIALLGV